MSPPTVQQTASSMATRYATPASPAKAVGDPESARDRCRARGDSRPPFRPSSTARSCWLGQRPRRSSDRRRGRRGAGRTTTAKAPSRGPSPCTERAGRRRRRGLPPARCRSPPALLHAASSAGRPMIPRHQALGARAGGQLARPCQGAVLLRGAGVPPALQCRPRSCSADQPVPGGASGQDAAPTNAPPIVARAFRRWRQTDCRASGRVNPDPHPRAGKARPPSTHRASPSTRRSSPRVTGRAAPAASRRRTGP